MISPPVGHVNKYQHPMKSFFFVLLLAAAICGGCATRYDITLTNGDVITARGRPRFDKDKQRYYYTDAGGKPANVSGMRVREVAPESMREPDNSNFKPSNAVLKPIPTR
jgi:hypothetical protein